MSGKPSIPKFDLAAATGYNDRKVDLRTPEFAGQLAHLVAFYQQEHGLVADGKLGPQTMRAISSGVADGTREAFTTLGPRTRDQAIKLIDWSVQQTCYYDLSAGGNPRDPGWPNFPWDEQRQCDCSAYVGWLCGYARNDGDWNTTRVIRDAVRRNGQPGPEVMYIAIEDDTEVREGDIIVKDGVFDPKTGKRLRPGHIGMIRKVLPGFDRHDSDFHKSLMVAHCSPTNSAPPPQGRGTGHAIAVTDAFTWTTHCSFADNTLAIVRFKAFDLDD